MVNSHFIFMTVHNQKTNPIVHHTKMFLGSLGQWTITIPQLNGGSIYIYIYIYFNWNNHGKSPKITIVHQTNKIKKPQKSVGCPIFPMCCHDFSRRPRLSWAPFSAPPSAQAPRPRRAGGPPCRSQPPGAQLTYIYI